MRAVEAKLLDFIKKSPQFIIPIYQRTYSWTEKQCRQLWDDILRTGVSDNVSVHFIGSIVYIEQGLSQVSRQAPLLVIDGQQRLTTITLLLEALARSVKEEEPVDGFSGIKIREYYLSNRLEQGDRFFKLLLTQTDNESLKTIIKNTEEPRDSSLRISQNFNLFMEWIEAQKGDFGSICRGLAKLVVVDIALDRDHDNPQLIFESMNSTGKELSQADLIRNFILMGLEPELQTRLYDSYWRPMEVEFGQEAYNTKFDGFMRHYLTIRTGSIPREDDVYEAFKEYAHAKAIANGDIENLVKEIRAFAHYFCAIALGKEPEPKLRSVFHDLRELKVDVAYPFLLDLYEDYVAALLTVDELAEIVRLVEAYVFRRSICNIPTNSLNKTFATFTKELKKDRYMESIRAHFLLLPSYRRFPSDDEFQRDFQTRDLYNFRNRTYWLRKFENFNRKERVNVDEYTIEHILPQNEELSAEWRSSLGTNWHKVQEQYLHTLGNLTLTGYNSEYSDRPFNEKRDMDGGFAQSPLRLNEGLKDVMHWNEAAIKARADRLASRAVSVWYSPKIDEATLNLYRRVEATSHGCYTIDDHPYLAKGSDMYGSIVPDLFTAFRKEVLALDPNVVTEEFLKLYVAYKAETNFVDVIPQAKRLLLSINIPFTDINDPKLKCRDVSGMGRWGNGDVEVGLESMNDLPYIMSLIRQAYERQMSDGDEI